MCLRLILLLAQLPLALACDGLSGQGGLPPIPMERGTLTLRVQYPEAGSVLNLADSTFLFGTVGDGQSTLTINGVPVPVAANGAWLAWVGVPADSQPLFRLQTRSGRQVLESELRVVRAGWVTRQGAWAAAATMHPTGAQWRPAGERVLLSVEARAGARVRLLREGHVPIAFVPSAPVADTSIESTGSTYQAFLAPEPGSTDPGWLSSVQPADGDTPILEVVVAGDTTQLAWPLSLRSAPPVHVRLNDNPLGLEPTDAMVTGRNRPGGNYHWFFPNGTIATAEARDGESIRLRLGDGAVAWVARSEIAVHPAGLDVSAIMGSPSISRTADGVSLRIPLDVVVPHQVSPLPDGLTISLFGVTADADWIRYPVGTEFVSWVGWQQHASDRIELTVRFGTPLFGWRVHAASDGLVFEFREAPVIDPVRPLNGRVVVLDPGHPPEGACGPTGLCESVATLAVARIAADLLQREGARVHLTRERAGDVPLSARVALAAGWDAEALVSIHLNAHPDGVNPFTESGTSTFFQHPQSLPLARELQAAMVARFGIPDLGVMRGDLALVRPTWFPAVLTEGLYMMIPAQEAAIRMPVGQALYAEAIVAGVRAFFANLQVSTDPGVGRLPVEPPPVFHEP